MIIDTIILVRCVPSTIHDQQTITVLETIGKVIKMDQENNLLEGRSIQTLDMMRLFILYQRLIGAPDELIIKITRPALVF